MDLIDNSKRTEKEISHLRKKFLEAKNSSDISQLMEIKDEVNGYMYNVGYYKSEFMYLRDECEREMKDDENRVFLTLRGIKESEKEGYIKEKTKFTEAEAKSVSRKMSSIHLIDYNSFNLWYGKMRDFLEVLKETSHSLSQRISVLKNEKELNQFVNE